MRFYTLGKIEFERHADAVMTSLADSVVRHMSELDEANARIAALEEEQGLLRRERDEARSETIDLKLRLNGVLNAINRITKELREDVK